MNCKVCGKKVPEEVNYKNFCHKRCYDSYLKKEHIKNGVCYICGKNPPECQRKKCKQCLIKEQNYLKKTRQRLIKQGLCVVCRKENDNKNKKICKSCIIKGCKRHKIKKQKYLITGQCHTCGKESLKSPNRINSNSCKTCYLKTLSRTHFKKSSYWQELEELFKKQNICPFSGKKLILGVNTSLDHKIPKSRGGENNIDNLQWVYLDEVIDINRVKGDLTDYEFRSEIRKISNHISNPSVIDLSFEVELSMDYFFEWGN